MDSEIGRIFERFDGKSVEPFRSVAELLEPTAGNLRELVRMAGNGSRKVEIGATWVVKHLVETGELDAAIAADELISLLERVEHDESRLHLLQTLPHLELPAASLPTLHDRLLTLLDGSNKFVRAWSYNGMALLARADSSYLDETLDLFSRAMETESAAVKARIRNALKTL